MIRELEDVRDELLAGLKPMGSEVRALEEADGLVLAESPLATIALPPFDNSAMDGYAVRAADVRLVPTFLKQVGEVAAGGGFDGSVGPGETVRIFTGAPIPSGADAVPGRARHRRTARRRPRVPATRPRGHLRRRCRPAAAPPGSAVRPPTRHSPDAAGSRSPDTPQLPLVGAYYPVLRSGCVTMQAKLRWLA